MSKKQNNRAHQGGTPIGWEPLAAWYDGWVGQHGSRHHRQRAIPATLELLQPQPGEHILDIGCGQGVLAPYIARQGAHYTGIDVSPHLLKLARKRHAGHGRFLRGDARHLTRLRELESGGFAGVVFLLSIQDMDPLVEVLRAAEWALDANGRLVILMTHPCFRIPRQSGWGHDPGRKLQYRRVDSYLTPLTVPMKQIASGGVSISFHRPLSDYVNALGTCGLLIDALHEITMKQDANNKAERRAQAEFPLFLGLRARKITHR